MTNQIIDEYNNLNIFYFLFYIINIQISSLFSSVYSLKNFFKSYKINDHYLWSKLNILVTNSKFNIINGSDELYEKPCLYFMNHRDLFDFPIDCYLTAGLAAVLSRYLVIFLAPYQSFVSIMLDNVFFFKRDKNINHTNFNKWIINRLNNSPYDSLIIYPEGTRRHDNELCDIKKGGMHIAYDNNLPIQIIITKNKEYIFSFKKMISNYGVELYTYRSNIIYPSNFSSKQEFINEVEKNWKNIWEIVYNTNFESKPYIQKDILKNQNIKTNIRWNLLNLISLFIVFKVFKRACL